MSESTSSALMRSIPEITPPNRGVYLNVSIIHVEIIVFGLGGVVFGDGHAFFLFGLSAFIVVLYFSDDMSVWVKVC